MKTKMGKKKNDRWKATFAKLDTMDTAPNAVTETVAEVAGPSTKKTRTRKLKPCMCDCTKRKRTRRASGKAASDKQKAARALFKERVKKIQELKKSHPGMSRAELWAKVK